MRKPDMSSPVRLDITPQKEIADPRKSKLAKTREFMTRPDVNVDALWLTSPADVRWLTNAVSAESELREFAVVVVQNTPEQFFLASVNQPNSIKAALPLFEYRPIAAENQQSQHELAKQLVTQGIHTVGINSKHMTVDEYHALQEAGLTVQGVPTYELRSRKTPEEIEAIRKACEATDKVFAGTLPLIREGVTESELASLMKKQMETLGFADESFPALVAFGDHSAIPHYITGNTPLLRNQFVLLDFGLKDADGYQSDMTRTIFFGKKEDMTPEQVNMYKTAHEASTRLLAYLQTFPPQDFVNENVDGFAVDKLARDYIFSQGYTQENFPHPLGHGLGIETQEFLRLSFRRHDTLQQGMVFTIEPAVYVANIGGVRIEDDLAITPNGVQVLTHSPRDLICIDPESGRPAVHGI